MLDQKIFSFGKLNPYNVCDTPQMMTDDQVSLRLMGYLVWWDLEEDIDIVDLERAWTRRVELPPQWLPRAVGPTKALARAIRQTEAGTYRRQKISKGSGGYEIIAKNHKAILTIWTEATKRFVKIISTPQDHELIAPIEQAFIEQLRMLSPMDVSTWMSKLVRKYNSVLVRPAGGVYFMPTKWIASWNRVVAAIREASSHRFYRMPVVADHISRLILNHAITREIEGQSTAIKNRLYSKKDTLNKVAYAQILRRIDRIEAKVSYYEKITELGMLSAHNLLNELRFLCHKGVMDLVGPLIERNRKSAS